MKQKYLVTALGAVVGVLSMAVLPAEAATSYSFVVRGVVDSVDTTKKTVQVTGTYASTKAVEDTVSKKVEYSVKSATFYKWEGGMLVLRNIKHVKVSDEVVMSGTKTTGGTFNVTKLTVNDRMFEVVGRVKDYNTAENWIEVLVGRSTLKHKSIANTRVKFYYHSGTKCMRLGNEIGCSEIVTNDQGIKVKGSRTGTDGKWEITHAWNNFPV